MSADIAEKKKQGCGLFSLLVLAVAFLWLKDQACGTTPPKTVAAPRAEDTQAAKPSGAPVVSYSIVHTKGPLGREWIYAVPERRPSDQELIDLAFDLRKKFPSASFEIVDSVSSIKQIQAADDGDTSVSEDFVKQHEIAMLNKFVDPGYRDGFRWKLIGSDDHIIAAFQNSPADIAEVESNRRRVDAETNRMNLEHERCDKLKNKAIVDMTSNDLETISGCKAEGNW